VTITTVITKYVTETITTCAPGVSDCSAQPQSRTITSTITKVVDVYTTVIVTPASVTANAENADAATSTETTSKTAYTTDYYTTIIDVLYASSNSLYNPHSDDESTTGTSTTTLHMTSTVYLTETVGSAKPTSRSTSTITSTLTVFPLAEETAKPNPTKDTQVYSPADQKAQAVKALALAQQGSGTSEGKKASSGSEAGAESDSDHVSGSDSGSDVAAGSDDDEDSTGDDNDIQSAVEGAAHPTGYYPHAVVAAAAASPSPTVNATVTYHNPVMNRFEADAAFKIAAVVNAGDKAVVSTPAVLFGLFGAVFAIGIL